MLGTQKSPARLNIKYGGPIIASQRSIYSNSLKMNLFLGPQIGFIGGCVGAIVAYIYFNLDDIKASQKLATDKAMAEQAVNIRSAQDSQRAAVEKARLEQEKAGLRAKQIAEDAKRRADEAGRR